MKAQSPLLLALAASVQARKCQNLTIPVTISARNGVFDQKVPVTDTDVTNFLLDFTQPSVNYSQSTFVEFATVSGTYNLAATYCEPDNGPGKVAQVLTHGIAFDRSYWDLPANNYNYSYVAQAVDEYGYSTLAYDRLGIGMSQHGDPVNEIQTWLEVAALAELTKLLRAGKIAPSIGPFSSVVHAGHSFGSVQTYQLAVTNPELSDAIILTGFSQNGNFLPYFGLGGNFVVTNANSSATGYVNGYLSSGDRSAVHTNFFTPVQGQWDPVLLDVAWTTGQPVTVGELLTIGNVAQAVNPIDAPVLVITGERDIPFCGGNCFGEGKLNFSSIPAATKGNFPNATAYEAFIVPDAGHGLNLEYSHTLTYKTILDFLAKNGIKP